MRRHTRHRIGTLALACIIVILVCSVPLSALAVTDTTAPQQPTSPALLDLCIGIGPIEVGCDSGDSDGGDRDRHEDDGDENTREDTEDGDRDNHEDTDDENTREGGEQQQKPPVTLPETEPPVTTISPSTETETPPTQTAGASAPISDEEDQESEEDNARTETTATTTTTAHSGDNGSNGTNGGDGTTDETTPETATETQTQPETRTERPSPPTTTEPTQSQSQSSADDATTINSNTERTTDSTRKQTTQTATPIGQPAPTTETRQRAQAFAVSSDRQTPSPTQSTLPTPTQTTTTERRTVVQPSSTDNTPNTRFTSNTANTGNGAGVLVFTTTGDTQSQTVRPTVTPVTDTQSQTHTATVQTVTAAVNTANASNATTSETTNGDTDATDTVNETDDETPIALMDNQQSPPFPFGPFNNTPFSSVAGGLMAAGLVVLGLLKASPTLSGTDVSMASSMGTTSRLASSQASYRMRRRLGGVVEWVRNGLDWIRWFIILIGAHRADIEAVLSTESREQTYDVICDMPGQSRTGLEQATGYSNSTIRDAVSDLADVDLIEAHEHHGKWHYYPADKDFDTWESALAAAMHHPTRRQLLNAIAAHDDAPSFSTLAETRDTSIGDISHHIDTLTQDDLVIEKTINGTTYVSLPTHVYNRLTITNSIYNLGM